jgi:hypothetical protein
MLKKYSAALAIGIQWSLESNSLVDLSLLKYLQEIHIGCPPFGETVCQLIFAPYPFHSCNVILLYAFFNGSYVQPQPFVIHQLGG